MLLKNRGIEKNFVCILLLFPSKSISIEFKGIFSLALIASTRIEHATIEMFKASFVATPYH
jgi:hypothetical protein